MSGSGSKTTTQYVQSPEQQKIMKYMLPIWKMAGASARQSEPWDYLNAPMPTMDLMGSIDPGIKAGVWQPYEEAWNNLSSQAMGQGLGVSARGGWSGQMGNLFTDFASKAGTQYGQQLWNMVNPNMMAAWQMPYQLAMGSLGQTLPTNVVQQQSGGFGSALSGAAMGGLAGGMLPASLGLGPWGLAVGAGLGLLGGLG